MEVIVKKEASKLVLAIDGRIDSNTAPELEKAFDNNLDGVTELILDFAKSDYISSAGLRILLQMQKTMNSVKGSMVLKNVSDSIMEVFTITGFENILTIEV